MRLTSAGQILYDFFERAQWEYQAAYRQAQDLYHGQTGRLRIGMLDGQMMNPVMKEVVAQFERRHPNITLEFFRGSHRELIRGLSEGTADLAELPAVRFLLVWNAENSSPLIPVFCRILNAVLKTAGLQREEGAPSAEGPS